MTAVVTSGSQSSRGIDPTENLQPEQLLETTRSGRRKMPPLPFWANSYVRLDRDFNVLGVNLGSDEISADQSRRSSLVAEQIGHKHAGRGDRPAKRGSFPTAASKSPRESKSQTKSGNVKNSAGKRAPTNAASSASTNKRPKSAAVARQKKQREPIVESLSVKELKAQLDAASVSYAGCVEKTELQDLLRNLDRRTQQVQKQNRPQPESESVAESTISKTHASDNAKNRGRARSRGVGRGQGRGTARRSVPFRRDSIGGRRKTQTATANGSPKSDRKSVAQNVDTTGVSEAEHANSDRPDLGCVLMDASDKTGPKAARTEAQRATSKASGTGAETVAFADRDKKSRGAPSPRDTNEGSTASGAEDLDLFTQSNAKGALCEWSALAVRQLSSTVALTEPTRPHFWAEVSRKLWRENFRCTAEECQMQYQARLIVIATV